MTNMKHNYVKITNIRENRLLEMCTEYNKNFLFKFLQDFISSIFLINMKKFV